MERIIGQIQLAAKVLEPQQRGQIVAWEWTSCLSPSGGTGKANISKLALANWHAYARYVHDEQPPALKCDDHGGVRATPLAAFHPPHHAEAVVNATIFSGAAGSAEDCARRCLGASGCIAFTWHGANSSCDGSGWSPQYAAATAPRTTAYYARIRHTNTSRVRPAVAYPLSVPTRGVTLGPGPLRDAFDANVNYLLQFPVDDLLHWFEARSGVPQPAGQNWGWDNGGPDKPRGLRGSVAGAFLMGAGGAVRWDAAAGGGKLRQRMRTLVQGIRRCQASDGYIQAFPQNESWYQENPGESALCVELGDLGTR